MSDIDVLSPEKQQQILRGAATVFSQDGYEGASMSRIAACAGVSKGTLYNYFDGKAGLFVAWVGGECEAKLAHVFDTTDPDGAPEDGLRAIGLRMLRMMMSESAKFPELARAFFDAGPSRATAFMAAWLERQAAGGKLQISDPVFAAEQFFSLCQTRIGMLRRLGLMTEPDDKLFTRVVDASVTMFLNTYGVKA
jgi:TetR/AcrR family transcriptional repressor of mexJK operon